MNKRRILIWLLVFVFGGVFCCAAGELSPGLLRDGYAFTSVQGTVMLDSEKGIWLFEFAEDVNDLNSVVQAGTALQLLPSTWLEKLREDLATRQDNTYLLNGTVTQYKGRNFIFPSYFRSVTIVEEEPAAAVEEPETPVEPDDTVEPNEPVETAEADEQVAEDERDGEPGDANSLVGIPQDVLDRINSKKVIRNRVRPRPVVPKVEPEQVDKPEPKEETQTDADDAVPAKSVGQPERTRAEQRNLDTILANRLAFLDREDDGDWAFVLDAYGLSAKRVRLELLPCQALEIAEARSKASPVQLRFKIAGIRTRYQGKDYLLLQRAARVFSHGNFQAFTPE